MGNNITVIPWIYVGPSPTVTQIPSVPQVRNKTRLGLVGETLRGPAFNPMLVKNSSEFTNLFGNVSNLKDGVTNLPRYELPFIANSFLNESDSLFVTRVLGLSGYDAGYTWGITLKSNYDPTTVRPSVTGLTYPTLFTFTADSQSTIIKFVSNDSLLQTLWDNNHIPNLFNNIDSLLSGATNSNFTAGTLSNIGYNMFRIGSSFTGVSINNFYLKNYTAITSGTVETEIIYYTGQTSGITNYYSASTYSDVEDLLVATIKSRATYDDDENLNFYIKNSPSSLNFDTTVTGATVDVYGDFGLKWTTNSGITGSTIVTFDNKKNNYVGNLLNKKSGTSIYPIYVDDVYDNLISNLNNTNRVIGINLSLIKYTDKFKNYKDKFKPSVTPWVVSQVRGSNINRLFRFWSIGDGDYTSNLFKVTISNIYPENSNTFNYDVNKPDKYKDYKFDVTIRDINNSDTSFMGFTDEVFKECSMNPKSVNFIGKMIGTKNGDYESKSKFVLVEINEEDNNDLSLYFPAGFVGYPIIDYDNTTIGTAKKPFNIYKTTYDQEDIVSSTFLGLSDSFGYDKTMFTYKGLPNNISLSHWTGMTKGFHMDVNATGATIDGVKISLGNNNYYSPIFEFETGNDVFNEEEALGDTQYADLESRKFTFMAYGGFDGWDIHRLGRTNSDKFKIDGRNGILGESKDNFDKITLTNNETGINSDYYAYLEGIRTFNNTDYVNINLFATPGIDTINHNSLVESAIDFIEFERADALYIVTTPDKDSYGNNLDQLDVITFLEGTYNTSYAATYWPWVNVTTLNIWLPPTISVVTAMAKNDNNNSFPWIPVAGMSKGSINVTEIRKKTDGSYLTEAEVGNLYVNRINPLIHSKLMGFEGYKIWGDKTLSDDDILANRVHIRRLLLEVKDMVIKTCRPFLFEQNDNKTKRDIENRLNPELNKIMKNRGLSQFKLVFDKSIDNTDKGILSGKLFLKPINAIEYIIFIFSITPKDGEVNVEIKAD